MKIFYKIFSKTISVPGAGPLELSILSPPSPVMPGQTVQFLCRAVPVQPRPRALVTLQWVSGNILSNGWEIFSVIVGKYFHSEFVNCQEKRKGCWWVVYVGVQQVFTAEGV